MVLCLDDLALLDCLQFLIIFVLCKFIIQSKYYLSVEIFLNIYITKLLYHTKDRNLICVLILKKF